MSSQTVIFIGVAMYVVLMLEVSVWASKRNTTTAEFMVAGRSMPMFLLTGSIVATWFGGSSMMGETRRAGVGLTSIYHLVIDGNYMCHSR
jgi:Na+/proline symporter